MYRELLVEDDTALRFVYSRMKAWDEYGFSVAAQASDGSQALSMLKKDAFDLVFTDIRMPVMDGIELLKRVKGDPGLSAVPVIFASSYDDFEYARQGLILGAFDYLLKPMDEKKLSGVLARVVEHLKDSVASKVDPVLSRLLAELKVDPAEDEFVRQTAEYCSAHYLDGISADELAEVYGFGRDWFTRVFRQHFGISFRDFAMRTKVAYAQELLRSGRYRAYEVSDMLGFSTYAYFTTKYKELTGVAPSDAKFGGKPEKARKGE